MNQPVVTTNRWYRTSARNAIKVFSSLPFHELLKLIGYMEFVTQLLQLQHYGIMGIIRSERSVETGLAPFCLCLRYQKGIQASRGLNKSTAASLLRWVHSTCYLHPHCCSHLISSFSGNAFYFRVIQIPKCRFFKPQVGGLGRFKVVLWMDALE